MLSSIKYTKYIVKMLNQKCVVSFYDPDKDSTIFVKFKGQEIEISVSDNYEQDAENPTLTELLADQYIGQFKETDEDSEDSEDTIIDVKSDK